MERIVERKVAAHARNINSSEHGCFFKSLYIRVRHATQHLRRDNKLTILYFILKLAIKFLPGKFINFKLDMYTFQTNYILFGMFF